MRDILLFSVLLVMITLVFTHFYNAAIPEHEYPRFFKFLKNI